MKDLLNYTILITGGASGNGLGIAKYCLDFFKEIILVDKNKDKLSQVKDTLVKSSNKSKNIQIISCDLESYDERERMISYLIKKYSKIHCIVNNAGISKSIDESKSFKNQFQEWNRTIEINLTAPYHLCSQLKNLIPDKIGTIINITSLNSNLAFPGNPSYMASKGGLKQLTQSFAYDFAPRGIRVNSIAPGYMKTNMTSISWEDPEMRLQRTNRTMLGRWGLPSDLGGIVCFLASNISSYITAEEIYIDGGWSKKGL